MSQCAPGGTEEPIIAFASKTLTSTEKNYSQLEKEAVSIIFDVRKCHQYMSGRHFQLATDLKPLLAIFSPEKSLPVMTLQRLQRWALIMMDYDYHIVYRKSADHANADALARLPIGSDPNFDKEESIFEIDSVVNMLDSHVILNLPLSAKTVADYTRKDTNQPENMSAWSVPDHPWQLIHVDFAGPFLDDMWLVVIDAYSKWPHFLKVNKYQTSETITSAFGNSFAI